MMRPLLAAALATAVTISTTANADTVVLNNGDTLNGKIGRVTASEIQFQSPAFGSITIPTANVSKYTFDKPVPVQPKGAPVVTEQVTGTATGLTVGNQTYTYGQIKAVNPPAQEWKGAILGNFSLARGNTNKFVIGAEAATSLRRNDAVYDDRTTLSGAYNFGESGGGSSGDDKVTDTDNWNIFAKHDRFWTDQLYGYVVGKLEHDRIADLYYRVSPGVGVGYQWIETPTTKLSGEAGVTYIHEEFDPSGTNDEIALRLAYNYTHQINDRVSFFHTLEFLPAFSDPSDYILNTDVGLRAKLTDNFFSQFKLLYKRDSTPAEGAGKNDLLYTIGVGWEF